MHNTHTHTHISIQLYERLHAVAIHYSDPATACCAATVDHTRLNFSFVQSTSLRSFFHFRFSRFAVTAKKNFKVRKSFMVPFFIFSWMLF